jgi:hypothetical protein
MAAKQSALDIWMKKVGGKAKLAEQAKGAKESNFENLDDGRYVGRLTSAELGESKSSDRPQIAWGVTVVEGDDAGEKAFEYDGLDGDESFYWISKKLALFGQDPEDVDFTDGESFKESLQNMLDAIVEDRPAVKIRLKTKDGFQHMYFEQVIEDYEGPDVEVDDKKKKPAAKPAAKADKPAAKGGPSKPVKGAKKADPEPEVEEEEVAEEEAEVEEDTVEISVGMKVAFEWKGEAMEGEIKEILESEEKVKVRCDGKIYPLAFDRITPAEVDK